VIAVIAELLKFTGMIEQREVPDALRAVTQGPKNKGRKSRYKTNHTLHSHYLLYFFRQRTLGALTPLYFGINIVFLEQHCLT
jgi:hypothetical protein